MLGYSPKTPAFHTHKVSSTGTLDLWRDGLLCAYEYIPAPKRKFKVGADFGNQNGDVQGRLDCKISVQPPYDATGVDSEDLPAGEGEGKGEGEGEGTLDGEVHKDEEKAMPPPSSSPRGFQKNKRKELGSQWVPIGWARLSELFQGVQVWGRPHCYFAFFAFNNMLYVYVSLMQSMCCVGSLLRL
jgi:hypothetical protein